MKSPTSFYNRALILSNLKRYGFVSVIFFLFDAVISNIGIMLNVVGRYNDAITYDYTNLMYPTPWQMFTVFVVPVIFGVVLFRYLMDEKALSAFHALPVSRRSLYGSQTITFVMLFGAPVLANGIISLLILLLKGYPMLMAAGTIGLGTGMLLLGGAAVYGLTMFLGLLVGSSVLQVALTYIFMGAPFMIVELIRVLIGWTLKGFPGLTSDIALHHYLTPYFAIVTMMGPYSELGDVKLFATLSVLALIALTFILGYVFYHQRDLERHTDLIVFEGAKIAFSILLTLMITLGLSALIGNMTGQDTFGAYIGLVFGALLGFVITKMIAEKTVAILPYWKQAVAVTFGSLLILGMVDLDLFGYESRIPEDEQIVFVYYNETSWLSETTVDAMEEALDNNKGGIFEEQSTIDLVKALHMSAIKPEATDHTTYKDFTILYVLKNGQRVHRVYSEAVDPLLVQAIHESQEYKEDRVDRVTAKILDNSSAEVSIYSGGSDSLLLEPSQYQGFIAAYKADFMRMSYLEETTYDSMGTIEVSILEDVRYMGQDRSEQRRYYTYPIWPSFVSTQQWLVDNGAKAFDLEGRVVLSATLREDYSAYHSYDGEARDDGFYETYNPADFIITDPELLRTLKALQPDYSRMFDKAYKVSLSFTDGGYYEFRVVDLPESLIPYVQPW